MGILCLLSSSERARQCSVWVFLSYLVWVKILLPALALLVETISPFFYARDREIGRVILAEFHLRQSMTGVIFLLSAHSCSRVGLVCNASKD